MKVAARAWYKDGVVVVDTDEAQYKIDVSMMDFVAMKAGGVADVELKVVHKNAPNAPPTEVPVPDSAAG